MFSKTVYPTRRISVEFSNNTLCYHPTSSSTKKLQVFCCSVVFFFFLLTVLFLQNIFGEGTKRICTNPLYMNQIFMLCPLEALSSSNLWNVISWPQHSGTSKSAALWAVLEAAENFYTFESQAYENLVAWLWHSLLQKCAWGKENDLVVPRLWHNLMLCHQEQAGWWTTVSAYFKLKSYGKFQP